MCGRKPKRYDYPNAMNRPKEQQTRDPMKGHSPIDYHTFGVNEPDRINQNSSDPMVYKPAIQNHAQHIYKEFDHQPKTDTRTMTVLPNELLDFLRVTTEILKAASKEKQFKDKDETKNMLVDMSLKMACLDSQMSSLRKQIATLSERLENEKCSS